MTDIAGRLIIGITGGILTTVVPVYLAEISPVNIRGLLGALNNLTLIIGAVVGMVTGINHVMGTSGATNAIFRFTIYFLV